MNSTSASSAQPHAASPIEILLSRLDGVKRTRKGWIAKCPAHEDRLPSLSLAEVNGGQVLLHCHAMCKPVDVLAAIGLQLSDLYRSLARLHLTPVERQLRREYAEAAKVRATLNVLSLESTVVLIAAGDMLMGRPFDWTDYCRLVRAEQLIQDAKVVLG